MCILQSGKSCQGKRILQAYSNVYSNSAKLSLLEVNIKTAKHILQDIQEEGTGLPFYQEL